MQESLSPVGGKSLLGSTKEQKQEIPAGIWSSLDFQEASDVKMKAGLLQCVRNPPEQAFRPGGLLSQHTGG